MVEAKKVPDTPEDVKNKNKTKNKVAQKPAKEDKPVKDVVKKPVPKGAAVVASANKGSFIARAKKFLRGAWTELKKVNWPGRKELVAFTGVVLVSVFIVGSAIFVVDTLLSKILSLVIK